MIEVRSFEFIPGSTKEKMDGMDADFPYMASYAALDQYSIPWHWHEQVELFYIESGSLEYFTPNGSWRFPAGTGGFVNRNVLHRTECTAGQVQTVQLLHIFDLSLLSGLPHGRIERHYFSLPLRNIEVIPIYADQAELLGQLRASFALQRDVFGYEISLCAALLTMWKQIASLIRDGGASTGAGAAGNDEKIKQMLVYVHEHYAKKISINDIASSGLVSQRECFRIFQAYVQCTPIQYCLSYRLHMACRMLLSSDRPVTEVALSCGFGNSSYFGKTFAARFGCTPRQYRHHWQDKTNIRQS